jgi:hypothetical protein
MCRHALMVFVAATSFGIATVTSAAAMNLNVGHGFSNNVGNTFGRGDILHKGGGPLGPGPCRGAGCTKFGPGPPQSSSGGGGGGGPPPSVPCPGNEYRNSSGFCVRGKPNVQ